MNIYDALILKAVGGGGGTTVVANPEGEATDELEKLQVGSDIYGIPKDYAELDNKPQINSVELDGNKTASDLGLQTELEGAQTVTGNPITITDAEPMNAESVLVELEPKQDLHGHDAPWVGGAGKNKFNPANYEEVDYDGVVYANPSAGASLSELVTLPAGTYTFSVKLISKPNVDRTLVFTTTPAGEGVWTLGHLQTLEEGEVYRETVTFESETSLYSYLYGEGGGTFKIQIQIEQGSTATSYAPYSNICPITGYSEVNLERVGKNLCDHSTITDGVAIGGHGGEYSDSTACTTDFIRIKAGKTVVFSSGFRWGDVYDLDENFTRVQFWSSYQAEEDCLIRVTFDISEKSTIQVEYDDVTTYEPYQGSTATIDLDGTKYGGTLDVTEGGYSDEWGYIEGDSVSDLGATIGTTSAGTLYVSLGEVSLLTDADTTPTRDQLQCNELCNKATNDIWYNNKSGVTCDAYGIVFFTVKDITTQADMDTWLSNNPIQIAYRKKTPSSVSTTPTDITLLENTNNISTDGTNITLKYQPNNVIGECKAYTDEQIEKVLPPLPTTDGTYHLSCEVTSGVGVLSWVSDS